MKVRQKGPEDRPGNPIVLSLQVLGTFLLVVFAWVFFRLPDAASTGIFFSRLIEWESSDFVGIYLMILVTFFTVTFVLDFLEYRHNSDLFFLKMNPVAACYGMLAGMFVVTLIFIFQAPALPFIYFQF